LDEYELLVARLRELRPFFDLMTKSLGRSPITGIQTFWNKDSYATKELGEGDWTDSGNPVIRHELYDIGMPACYSNSYATVTLLGKDNVYALSKGEIKNLLSKGVYMDAETLQHLNDMGFGKLTGFEVTGAAEKDRFEKFTYHFLNGDFAGRVRNCVQSFYPSTAYSIRKTDKKAQILSYLMTYQSNDSSSYTSGIFENKLGGRICVAGYSPWAFMGNFSKSSQMKSVFRWLSKDTLPGYIASFNKINLWIREPQNGKTALAFTNASFDPAKNLVLMLLTTKETLKLYDMQCKEIIIRSSGTDGPYRKFVIPEVGPWEIRLAVNE